MISPDIIIQDIDARGWTNLLTLADRATIYKILGEERKERPPKKRLTIVYQGTKVLKAYHSEKGSILENFQWIGPKGLEEVACQEDVDMVTAVERSAISRIMANFQAKIDMKDDYAKQMFSIGDALRDEIGNGLHFYPEQKIPNFKYETAQQIFKILTQDDSTLVFYVFEGNEVWTSSIAGIKDGNVDLYTTHDTLVADGFALTDWRKDYRRINDAIASKFRAPSVGFYTDLKSLARIMKSKKPVRALDNARKAKDVIIDPLPTRIKAVLKAGKLIGK